MMTRWFKNLGLVLVAGVLLNSCSFLEKGFYKDDASWVPEQTESSEYFLYQENDHPFCYPECKWFKVYLFEDGLLAFYGGRGLKVNGWHQKNLGSEAFLELTELLKQHRFFEYADDYSYGFEACGEPATTDVGELKLKYKTQTFEKSVFFDNGCVNSRDWGTIRHLMRTFRQLLPLEEWVGTDHYTRDYEMEIENVILKEIDK